MSSARYRDAIRYLYGLEPRGIRLELDRMRTALALRGHPERACRFVHVAGSNGKGSVGAMVESGLRAGGYRAGLYTSPHIHRFVERIRIGGRPVREAQVARRIEDIRATLERPDAPALTFFEVSTLLAFECFRDAGCDPVVLEVGLGGRLDATNVVEPEVSVITRLALEHTARLGSTMPEIAREKAGILTRGVPAVVGDRHPGARRVIGARARGLRAPVAWIDRDFGAERSTRDGRLHVYGPGIALDELRQPLPGAHQRDNVAIAAAVLGILRERGDPLPDRAIRQGIERARWPGRMERIRGRPSFLLDAAHNPDACAALAAHLDTLPRRGRRVLVFGAMADKEHEAMLSCFDDRVDVRIYAAPSMPRAASPEVFPPVRPGRRARSVRDALARARRAAGEQGLVVVAGSIFLLAEARALLKGVRSEPLVGM